MIKRSAEEWLALFAQQAANGLSAERFCKEQGLSNKHFRVCIKQLLSSPGLLLLFRL